MLDTLGTLLWGKKIYNFEPVSIPNKTNSVFDPTPYKLTIAHTNCSCEEETTIESCTEAEFRKYAESICGHLNLLGENNILHIKSNISLEVTDPEDILLNGALGKLILDIS